MTRNISLRGRACGSSSRPPFALRAALASMLGLFWRLGCRWTWACVFVGLLQVFVDQLSFRSAPMVEWIGHEGFGAEPDDDDPVPLELHAGVRGEHQGL